MKKIIKIDRPLAALLILAPLFFTNSLKAQEIVKGKPGMYPALLYFNTEPPVFTKGSVLLLDENGKADPSSSAILNNSEQDNLGMEHYRYQQTFAGIPIEHAIYSVHVKNGKVISQNGKWIRDFPPGLQTASTLRQPSALNSALTFIGAEQYKWQLSAEEAFIKREQNNPDATFYPKAELVFYSGSEEDVIPSALRLAYKFDIYAQTPVSRQIVFVDAQNGKILGKRELIHTTDVPGTALTAYSGTQTITTEMTGANNYRLHETGRGKGINTYDMKKGGYYGTSVDFTDTDNNWNNVNANLDQYATDAHWGAEKTYDYYLNKYNRNSIDNAGFALHSYVHYSINHLNAYWDGSRMTYGDAYVPYTPLTTLDIAGHEITHGLTTFTSNLTYAGESGAMNEGFSDIFGTAIEFYGNPATANWTIAEKIGLTLRNMANPNAYGQPDTYHGTNWYYGSGDYGGVHTNSGVLNFWFYLLVNGGNGTNDIGNAYNVPAIGMDKAAAIAYRLNTYYLISTSNYSDARAFGIQAAGDLYGYGSAEVIAVTNAFYAVGIGAEYNCMNNITLNASIINMSNKYEVSDYIIASSPIIVSAGKFVKFDAGNYIELQPGFEINAFTSGYFSAYIDGCGDPNTALIPELNTLSSVAADEVNKVAFAERPLENPLKDIISNDVSIYPNPNKGLFTINTGHIGNGIIEVYTISGSRIYQTDLKANISEYHLDLSAHRRGMYLIKITPQGKETIIQKLLIE